jgi:SAM-dependent methyltransferase
MFVNRGMVAMRLVGPEAQKNWERRKREGFFETYLAGRNILDIGYRGSLPNAVPIVENAVGVELDYPGYDGTRLPFADGSQDAVFVSHCLEHISGYGTVLADWYRVLRLGGFLLIMVPHRDLYERKATLPSRFNEDHKRFYTPASLLAEIEASLPVGGFRVRSLRDLDAGFDYGLAPETHAQGSYEIELVLERVARPSYVHRLRPSEALAKILANWAELLCEVGAAEQIGDLEGAHSKKTVLLTMQLPPFPVLLMALKSRFEAFSTAEQGPYSIAWLRSVLAPIICVAPFDEAFYIRRYKDIAEAAATHGRQFPRNHYIRHGYFEGRFSHPDQLV